MISDVKFHKATFLFDNITLLENTFGYDKSMISGDK